MYCYKPSYLGIKKFNWKKWCCKDDFKNGDAIAIACGKCNNCVINKQLSITNMLLLEAKNKRWYYAYFVTLTYNNDNLESAKNENVKYLQNWLKLLRKKTKLKYLISTELGSNTFRLHNHAFILSEAPLFQKNIKGKKIHNNYYYACDDSYWRYGFHSITRIDIKDIEKINKTIKYVVKYVAKNPLNVLKSHGLGFDYINKNMDSDGRYIYNGRPYWKKGVKKYTLDEIQKNNYEQYSSCCNTIIKDNRTLYIEPVFLEKKKN